MSDQVNILIVDDRKENILALEAVLANKDYHLIKAESGEEALKYVLLYDFAVILLDVQMPGLNGFETAHIIKQRESSRHIPIIFITALSKASEHVAKGYAQGAIDYMFKPFNPDILRSKVDAFVQLYIKQRELKRERDKLEHQSKELERKSSNLESIILDKTEELVKANEKLQFSQELFEKLFQFSPNMKAIRSEKDYRYIAINKSWQENTGYTLEEMQQHTTNMLSVILESEQSDLGKPHDLIPHLYNEKVTFVTKNNGVREGLLSTESVVINGEPCIISVITDTTEISLLEKELTRLDRLNLVGEMAAGIAHEIRNPMTTVLGFLQLSKNSQKYPDQIQYMDLMIDELNRANKIISEFLALAKNKATNQKPEDLNGVIKALFPLLQADAVMESKVVELDLQACPLISIDEKEIRQLVLNICLNGLQAMKAGGRLRIQTYQEDLAVVLRISDEGPGIEEEVLKSIGTPFYTTKEQGTGLGLAICYSIASRHHAKIDIETGSEGTSFIISFPLVRMEYEIV